MHIIESELIYETSRASGPGGQHVQKTSSRVTLRWNVNLSNSLDSQQKEMVFKNLSGRINKLGEFIIHVESHRSQLRNKKLAYQLLLELVAAATKKPKIRKKTKPTFGSIERRLKDKNIQSQKKANRKE